MMSRDTEASVIIKPIGELNQMPIPRAIMHIERCIGQDNLCEFEQASEVLNFRACLSGSHHLRTERNGLLLLGLKTRSFIVLDLELVVEAMPGWHLHFVTADNDTFAAKQ